MRGHRAKVLRRAALILVGARPRSYTVHRDGSVRLLPCTRAVYQDLKKGWPGGLSSSGAARPGLA